MIAVFTETLTVARGSTDNRGNRATTGTHTIGGVIAPGTPHRNTAMRHGESASGSYMLYADKGVNLRPRDRVTCPRGNTYAVVAGPLWDQVHALTGHDYGWTVFVLDAING